MKDSNHHFALTILPVLPLAATTALAITIDGQFDDWSGMTPAPSVTDPADMFDPSGDIRSVSATVAGDNIIFSMTAEGTVAPTVEETPDGGVNRYYYHWIVDIDNNPATGSDNSEYEENPTGLESPIGYDRVVQIGWRDGAAEPTGVYVYDPADDDIKLYENFPFERSPDGKTLSATVPYASLDLAPGDTIAFSAFQEGQSNGWQVDWVESAELDIPSTSGSGIASVEDGVDMFDSSGDVKLVQAATDGTFLFLRMAVEGVFGPTLEETPDGGVNRYYYHWILDIDNNPATGSDNSEYEENPTGLESPIGYDRVVQIGWRDGAAEPTGVYVYDPADDDIKLLENYEFSTGGDSVEARIALADLDLSVGDTIAFSAFQEGQSNGWQVDWVESATITLLPPSDEADLVDDFEANPYAFWIRLGDDGDDVVDPATISCSINGTPVAATSEKDGPTTTVAGTFDPWLSGGETHSLSIRYRVEGSESDRVRSLSVRAPTYTVLNSDDSADEPVAGQTGFIAGVTQISELQGFAPSQHGNQSHKAERQFAGQLLDQDGNPFYNEASDSTSEWIVPVAEIPATVNWHDFAPFETGNFFESNGHTDEIVPLVEFSSNGAVVEILTYLELEAGFHNLAINTTGGYKFTTGPDGRDALATVVGEFNGSRAYSYQGQHYFSLLAPDSGLYPVRLLWFNSEPTNQQAQLEFYSIEGKRKVLINDTADADAIRAYRAATGTPPYVSAASPAPGDGYATPDTPVELVITGPVRDGSVVLTFDGATVAANVVVGPDQTTVTYQPTGLAWGSTHTVGISYETPGDPPVARDGTFDYSLYNGAVTLPAAWGTPVGTGSDPGFSVRTVQSEAPRANTVAAAEAQLAAGAGAGFTATATPDTIDYGLFSGDFTGLFDPDTGFIDAGLVNPAWLEDYVSMEVLTYLELPAGAHTLGVNSDDGFAVFAGPAADNPTTELDRYDGGRGNSSTEPQNLFDIIVETPGVYGFRLVWFQGTGDASVEWYSFDRQTEAATLLNSGDPGALSAFRSRGGTPVAASITLRREAGDLVIEWTGSMLEENPGLGDGGWSEVGGATSPMLISPAPTSGENYYRAR